MLRVYSVICLWLGYQPIFGKIVESSLEMIPGRELDALIAEKVFGTLKPGEYAQFLSLEGKQSFETTREQNYLCGKVLGTPDYSTSIADAWDIVLKLEGRFNFSMSRKWHYYIAHNFFGWLVSASFWNRKQFGPDSSQWVIAQTVPHSICLAALKAVGHE